MLGIVSVIMVAAMPCTVHGDPKEQLLQLFRSRLANAGVIEVQYAEPSGEGEQRAAVDFRTGAFYFASSFQTAGVQVDGTRYGGQPGIGGTRVDHKPATCPELLVAGLIPAVWWRCLTMHPELIKDARIEDTKFLVTIELPVAEYPGTPELKMFFDASGRLLRVRRPDFPEHGEIAYDERSPQWSPLPTRMLGSEITLITFDVPQGRRDIFTQQHVESISAQVRYNIEYVQARGKQSLTATESSTTANKNPGIATTTIEQWRWPMAAVGGSLILVTGGVWIWKRRRS